MIDEQLLTGRVRLPHGDRQLADPLPIAFAEPAVLVALGMRRSVFLPQQLQRDVLPAHFAVRPAPKSGSDRTTSEGTAGGNSRSSRAGLSMPSGSG